MWKDRKLAQKRGHLATWPEESQADTLILIEEKVPQQEKSRLGYFSKSKLQYPNNTKPGNFSNTIGWHNHCFYQALNWLFMISLVASTAPISIKPQSQHNFYGHLHLGWMLASFARLCFSAYGEFVYITLGLSDLECLLYGVESLTYILHIAYIMSLAWRWRSRIQIVFDAVSSFDLEMGYIINCRQMKRFVHLQLWLVGILGSSALVIDFGYHKWNCCRWLLSISTYVLPNVMSSVSFVQYYVLLQGIAWRLQKINQILQEELLIHKAPPRRHEVQKLRRQQAQLIGFTKCVNQVYGISILFVYVGSFINFNLNLFLAYKTLDRPETSGWFWWIYMILWLGMHMGKMFSILFFNHLIQREQSRSFALMSQVRLLDGHYLIETCKHFVLQLQCNVRENVVCSVIKLNLQFITALTMATTNVFIFLLQYDITFEALSKPANETKSL